MIYEQRLYEVAPGRTQELVERFEKHTLRLFSKHNIHPVIFGVPASKHKENIFFYIVQFNNVEQMKTSWDAFMDDEERKAIWNESNKNGKLVLDIKSEIYESVLT